MSRLFVKRLPTGSFLMLLLYIGLLLSAIAVAYSTCLLYTSPSPRDRQKSRMPSSA